jgi:hypothetical protein
MASLRGVFRLSKEEVKNSTPPGTATLVGKYRVRIRTAHPDSTHVEHLEQESSQRNRDNILLLPQPSTDPADLSGVHFQFTHRHQYLDSRQYHLHD